LPEWATFANFYSQQFQCPHLDKSTGWPSENGTNFPVANLPNMMKPVCQTRPLETFLCPFLYSDEEESTEEDDDDDEEDADGDGNEVNDDEQDAGAVDHTQFGVLSDTDSSDGESEKCPVCLNRIRDQDIGTPESCDHVFCLDCIQEWSKVGEMK
jgi:hypothetical protein